MKYSHGTLTKVAEIQLPPPNYKKQHEAGLRRLRRKIRKAVADGDGRLATELLYELEMEKKAWRDRKARQIVDDEREQAEKAEALKDYAGEEAAYDNWMFLHGKE